MAQKVLRNVTHCIFDMDGLLLGKWGDIDTYTCYSKGIGVYSIRGNVCKSRQEMSARFHKVHTYKKKVIIRNNHKKINILFSKKHIYF